MRTLIPVLSKPLIGISIKNKELEIKSWGNHMKIFEKTRTVQGARTIKRYKFLGLSLFKKDIDNNRKKFKLLGIPIYNRKLKQTVKRVINKKVKPILINGIEILRYKNIPDKMEFPKFESPLVSIIIPVFNQYKYTKECLWSILNSGENIPYEIIIADDNSEMM